MSAKKRTWSYIFLSLLIIAAYAAGNWMGAERAYGDIKRSHVKIKKEIDKIKELIPDVEKDKRRLIEILEEIEEEVRWSKIWNKQTTGPIRKTTPAQDEK